MGDIFLPEDEFHVEGAVAVVVQGGVDFLVEVDFDDSEVDDFGFDVEGAVAASAEDLEGVVDLHGFFGGELVELVAGAWVVVADEVLVGVEDFLSVERDFDLVLLLLVRDEGARKEESLVGLDLAGGRLE